MTIPPDENLAGARWRSEAGLPPPKRVIPADDAMSADTAYRLACEGTALLWQGDFQNARQLLNAMARRVDRKPKKTVADPKENFHLFRMAQAQRARILAMLLIPFEADHGIALRRAPDAREACAQAWDEGGMPYVAPLRDLLGAIGAYEWRKKGVEVAALGDRIHPHYGVFAPIRSEYVELVARAPLPPAVAADPGKAGAFDVGTGTGVLAAVLVRRGIGQVTATDNNPRALACAAENLQRLGFADRVQLSDAGLFPAGRAHLAVCNPPWLPGRAGSLLEQAVYDPESRMLRGFLQGLAEHLLPGGEGWLVLSDLAEHLGLRTREELLGLFASAGLEVVERLDARPVHPRAADAADPLHAARSAEVTSLWRLRAGDQP